MKWWHLALAMGAASGCATAPAPVAEIPAPPVVAPAPVEPDYQAMAFSEEFQTVSPAPAPARPAPLYVPGSVELGFSEKGGVPAEVAPEPAVPLDQAARPQSAPTSARHRTSGRLIAQSGK